MSNLSSSASVTLAPLRDSTRIAPVPVLAPVADERGRLQPRAPVLDVVGAVRVALPAELAQHAPALVARLADVAPRAFVAAGAAVVDAPDRALVGLDSPAPDLAHDGLRRPAEFLRDGVGRLARVQSCLYGEAFHRGQPRLLRSRPSLGRRLVCVHICIPFCARPSGAAKRIARFPKVIAPNLPYGREYGTSIDQSPVLFLSEWMPPHPHAPIVQLNAHTLWAFTLASQPSTIFCVPGLQ